MKLGTIMSVSDIPFYYYNDADGDQVALPSTERLIPESTAAHVLSQNLMPVLCIRGRPEIRLGSFRSLAGAELAGPWSPVLVGPDNEAVPDEVVASSPEVMSVAAFEAQATAEAENELDALLASLNSPANDAAAVPPTAEESANETAVSETAQSASQASEDDLDALLAGLATPEEPAAGSTDMDPDLAALLADL